MINVVFKVIDKNDTFVGFVKDSLLNLSKTADLAVSCEIYSKNELDSQTKKYQTNLNKILDIDSKNTAISRISNNIYKKHYDPYKLGELKVIPITAKKYLL